jgi:predicted  nucleic acid-binding Zn-ribbon protein
MNALHRIALIVVLAAAVGGCKPMAPAENTPPGADLAELRNENHDLRARNKRLSQKVETLEGRIEALATREQRLSMALRKEQRTSQKRAEALDLLRDLPAERDYFKAEAETLRTKNLELQKRIGELEAEIKTLKAQQGS